ncbi:hypothetical protein ABH939_002125 [Rhodococcus sp. 27YEA6]|nr:hypothetical protein BKP42_38450 [Rhodococcus erythropolis]
MLGQFMALLRAFIPSFATSLGDGLDGLNAISLDMSASGGEG